MSAEPVLTLEKASAIVAPIYEALNEPAKADVKSLVKQSTSLDFMSCATEGDCIGRESAITRFKVLGRIIPDLHWAIREIQVAGDVSSVAKRRALRCCPSSVFSPRGRASKLCRSTYISSKMARSRERITSKAGQSRSVNLAANKSPGLA